MATTRSPQAARYAARLAFALSVSEDGATPFHLLPPVRREALIGWALDDDPETPESVSAFVAGYHQAAEASASAPASEDQTCERILARCLRDRVWRSECTSEMRRTTGRWWKLVGRGGRPNWRRWEERVKEAYDAAGAGYAGRWQ